MKINGNDEILKAGYVDKPVPKEPVQKDEFKDILKASVERSTPHTAKIQSPPPMQPLSAIYFQPLSPENRRITVERVDNLLNLLDNYRELLADPQVTLRQMEPLLNTIEQEKTQLSSVLDSLESEDGLKDIVNRTLVTASLEIVKYNRGDYITS
jgi:hypothetical protein